MNIFDCHTSLHSIVRLLRNEAFIDFVCQTANYHFDLSQMHTNTIIALTRNEHTHTYTFTHRYVGEIKFLRIFSFYNPKNSIFPMDTQIQQYLNITRNEAERVLSFNFDNSIQQIILFPIIQKLVLFIFQILYRQQICIHELMTMNLILINENLFIARNNCHKSKKCVIGKWRNVWKTIKCRRKRKNVYLACVII